MSFKDPLDLVCCRDRHIFPWTVLSSALLSELACACFRACIVPTTPFVNMVLRHAPEHNTGATVAELANDVEIFILIVFRVVFHIQTITPGRRPVNTLLHKIK